MKNAQKELLQACLQSAVSFVDGELESAEDWFIDDVNEMGFAEIKGKNIDDFSVYDVSDLNEIVKEVTEGSEDPEHGLGLSEQLVAIIRA